MNVFKEIGIATRRAIEKGQRMKTDIRDDLVALLPRLRRFATGLTGNRTEADDLVQSACEKALKKQHQWQPGTRLDSWLYRIIQTIRIDQTRRDQRAPASIDRDLIAEPVDRNSEHAPEASLMLSKVSRMLNQLPEEQRIVMVLIAVEGHSYREVSDMLEVPTGTIMSRLYRARASIKSQIDGDSPAPTSAEV